MWLGRCSITASKSGMPAGAGNPVPSTVISSTTFSATSLNKAKLVPLPSNVAPSG